MTVQLEKLLRDEMRGEVLTGESLVRHTSLKLGGPADFFVIPADKSDFLRVISLLSIVHAPYFVIGGGYNLLVRDGGFRGVVVSLKRLNSLEYTADGCISAEAGVNILDLVRFTEQHEMTGLEFLSGIPGTVGGAVAVNAGAHGAAILDRVLTITTQREGKTRVRLREELDYGYRLLKLEPGETVLEIRFQLERGDRKQIGERIATNLAHRRTAQAVGYPNAGSFFKNPPGMDAWRLIDEAGFRGTVVGGAQVSEVHTNFLVNRGGATAADFLQLAGMIKKKVKSLSGVELEEEVRIVGEEKQE